MTLPPRICRPAALVAAIFIPSVIFAVPVAVNDSYSVNEDTLLSTGGGSLVSANFEGLGNVLTGPWAYLDKC